MVQLPQALKDWILSRLHYGEQPAVLLQEVMQRGYTFEAAAAVLREEGADISHLNAAGEWPDEGFYQALASEHGLLEHAEVEDFCSEQIQLYGYPGFLTESECDTIIAIASSQLRASEITATEGFEGFRTSSTCDLSFIHHPAISHLEQKIIATLQLGIGEGEVLQAQCYDIGQEFKAHTDYFEPGTQEYQDFASEDGQRTWTFMIYLNEDCQGGITEFPCLQRQFTPRTGYALIWNNLLANGVPNPQTLHHAHKVTAGQKFVVTKWFRTRD